MTPSDGRPCFHAMIRPTTIIDAPRLGARLGVRLTLASETFQHTGSFKFRAAYGVAAQVPQPKIITASSGNFGQALAFACRLLGKSCVVVMPSTSARVKVEAVREYGGVVDLIDVASTSRRARVEELARVHRDAYVASAYDDPLVIEGNASLGAELGAFGGKFDVIIAPVGGGGLTSGIVKGLKDSGAQISMFGAEPLLGNDAARSLKAGRIVANEHEPQTIADGARTVSLGQHNWVWLRNGLSGIIEVSDEQIREGVRLLFSFANLKSEPTGALGIGALLAQPGLFRDRAVCCVVSGGNVDPAVFAGILTG